MDRSCMTTQAAQLKNRATKRLLNLSLAMGIGKQTHPAPISLRQEAPFPENTPQRNNERMFNSLQTIDAFSVSSYA